MGNILLYGNNCSEKYFSHVTDKAKINIKDILYSKQEETVYIPLLLLEKKSKKTILNKSFESLEPEIKKSLVIIKNIEKLEIIENFKDKIDEITLLFGINIKKNGNCSEPC